MRGVRSFGRRSRDCDREYDEFKEKAGVHYRHLLGLNGFNWQLKYLRQVLSLEEVSHSYKYWWLDFPALLGSGTAAILHVLL